MMSERLVELLQRLRVGIDRNQDVSSLADAVENLVEADPEGSRDTVLAHTGDEGTRLWVIGLLGDPQDFDLLVSALADPELRSTALEALTNQADTDRVDEIARSFLDDPDPMIRSRAAGMVAFRAKPGALALLAPLADDPDPHVRMMLGWDIGGLRDRAAEPVLRKLLNDPDEQVRHFAARGLRRLDH
jgi:HEAT repeat protein